MKPKKTRRTAAGARSKSARRTKSAATSAAHKTRSSAGSSRTGAKSRSGTRSRKKKKKKASSPAKKTRSGSKKKTRKKPVVARRKTGRNAASRNKKKKTARTGTRKKTGKAGKKAARKPAARKKAASRGSKKKKKTAKSAATSNRRRGSTAAAPESNLTSAPKRASRADQRKAGMLDQVPDGARGSKTARKRRTELSPKQLEQFRQLLLKRRGELFGDVTSMETGALRGSESEAGHAPMHMADAGSDTYEQEFTLQLAASEREVLREIDLALVRIEEGTYGVCEVSGKPISIPRLQAKPWARVSIEVARERDRYHRFR